VAGKIKGESSDFLKKMIELKKSDGITSTIEDKSFNSSGKSGSGCDEHEIRKRFV
jgi:hypothetical protein